jgi:hypothetical protein
MQLAHSLAHFLVPRQSNNHKARLWHSPILLLIVVKLILLQIFLNFVPSFRPHILGYAANISPEEVVRLTNVKRDEAGLAALELNSTLSQAAQSKGVHMLANDYWAHVAPDGTEPWKFFTDVGYKYRFAGENLARDFSNPGSAVEAWMASPTHKENMLSPKYKEIGVAVVEGDLAGVDTTIIVQFFGTKFTDTVPVAPLAEGKSTTLEATPLPAAIALATPTPAQIPTPTTVAVAPTTAPGVLVSPFSLTRDVSLGLIGLLSVVMVVDLVVISKRKIKRVSGRNFAHLAFFGMVLAIILIARAGQIL